MEGWPEGRRNEWKNVGEEGGEEEGKRRGEERCLFCCSLWRLRETR